MAFIPPDPGERIEEQLLEEADGPFAVADPDQPPGLGPYQLAWRRLRRNWVALAFGGLFLLIVTLCLLAPVYSADIAHIGPNDESHLNQALSLTGVPIGPTWHSQFFLGADTNGRDVAVRLLYGGRNSLFIGGVATLITMLLATILGTIAGFFRGPIDGLLSRFFELLWAYPALLLGIALGVSLQIGGIDASRASARCASWSGRSCPISPPRSSSSSR
jgi:peptide/nickel transport system permease protein